jgi:hypothetical protein
MRYWSFVLAALMALAGCHSTSAPTGEPVAAGFSAAQVQQAMGKPLRVETTPGGEVWTYRDRPRNPNDFVHLGHRRRVEFDPVRRTNVIIVESVRDREFPELRSHTIRVTFRDGQVAAIDSTEDM